MVWVVLASKTIPGGTDTPPESYRADSFTRLYIADGEPLALPGALVSPALRPKVLTANTEAGETIKLASLGYYAHEHGADLARVDQDAWAKQLYFAYLKKVAATKEGGYVLMQQLLDDNAPVVPEPAPTETPAGSDE